ncbi:hypothetical protein LCGC14_1156860 [marine sediment metagenome]|uniref:Uncharacterized protein n=1 Tax=marine sediment metagenome TaxID=412755 RepID=A0A0F9LTT2_9ZZZZ
MKIITISLKYDDNDEGFEQAAEDVRKEVLGEIANLDWLRRVRKIHKVTFDPAKKD